MVKTTRLLSGIHFWFLGAYDVTIKRKKYTVQELQLSHPIPEAILLAVNQYDVMVYTFSQGLLILFWFQDPIMYMLFPGFPQQPR